MTPDEVLERIAYKIDQDARRQGNGWSLHCPCHDDENPSLSLNVGDPPELKLLWYCHAGCTQEAIGRWMVDHGVADLIAEYKGGATWTEAELEEARRQREEAAEQKVEHAYAILRAAKKSKKQPIAYLKARGIDQVPKNAYLLPPPGDRWEWYPRALRQYPAAVFPVRTGAKKITGCHVIALNKDADGKLAIEKPKRSFGSVRGGYILLGRPDPDQPLIIAEGPENGLSAALLAGDLPAIATAGKGNMKALTQIPACSEVQIARDRGARGAAHQLAARLALQTPVQIVVPPKLQGDNQTDWNNVVLKARDPKRVWERALEKAEVVDAARDRLPTMAEFMRLETPPLARLLDPVLLFPGLSMFHGEPSSGKTPLAVAMAYAAAKGQSLMDWKVERPYTVLYVDNELPVAQLKSYLRRSGPWLRNLIICNIEDLMLRGAKPVGLATEEGRAELDMWIDKHKPEFVILDSLFTLAPPDAMVQDVHQWKEISAWLLKHKFAGRHMMLLHHDGKGGQQYGTMVKMIHLDLDLQIKKRPEFDVDGGETAVAYELRIGKQRYLFGRDAAARIITCTIVDDRTRRKGEYVEWERTEHEARPKSGKVKSLETKEVEKMILETDKSDSEIASMVGMSRSWVWKLRQRLQDQGDVSGPVP